MPLAPASAGDAAGGADGVEGDAADPGGGGSGPKGADGDASDDGDADAEAEPPPEAGARARHPIAAPHPGMSGVAGVCLVLHVNVAAILCLSCVTFMLMTMSGLIMLTHVKAVVTTERR